MEVSLLACTSRYTNNGPKTVALHKILYGSEGNAEERLARLRSWKGLVARRNISEDLYFKLSQHSNLEKNMREIDVRILIEIYKDIFGEEVDEVFVSDPFANWDLLVINLADKLKDPTNLKHRKLAKKWRNDEFFGFEAVFRSNLEETIANIKKKKNKKEMSTEVVELFHDAVENNYWLDVMHYLREFGDQFFEEFFKLEIQNHNLKQEMIHYCFQHAPVAVSFALIKFLSPEQKLKYDLNYFWHMPHEMIMEFFKGLSIEFLAIGPDQPFTYAFKEKCPLKDALELFNKIPDDFDLKDKFGRTKYMIATTATTEFLKIKPRILKMFSGLSFEEMCKTDNSGKNLLGYAIDNMWDYDILKLLVSNLKTEEEISTCFNGPERSSQNQNDNEIIMAACKMFLKCKFTLDSKQILLLFLNHTSQDTIAIKDSNGCNLLFILSKICRKTNLVEDEALRILEMATIEDRMVESKVKMRLRETGYSKLTNANVLMYSLHDGIPLSFIRGVLKNTPLEYRDYQHEETGKTALMLALERGSSLGSDCEQIIELLLEGTGHEHLSIMDSLGRNVLHAAMSAFCIHIPSIKLIMSLNQEYKIQIDKDYNTPLDIFVNRDCSLSWYCQFLDFGGNPSDCRGVAEYMKSILTDLMVQQQSLQWLWVFDVSKKTSNGSDLHFNDEIALDTIIWSGVEYITGPLVKDYLDKNCHVFQ